MPIDTVIFDLDDTLIDWWGSINACLATFADDQVIDALHQYCRRELWQTAPDGDHIWRRNTWALHTNRHTIWPEALRPLGLDTDEIDLLMTTFDRELWVGFFPDTVPVLDALVDRHRLAVLTNNHLLADEVERLRLTDWFEICRAALHPIHKPSPDAFRLILDALGNPPAERCVYVGDSIKSDVLGARNAGLIPVWLNSHGDTWPDRPVDVHEIRRLNELRDVLDHLTAAPGPASAPK